MTAFRAITFTEGFGRLDESRLRSFEAAEGLTLPEDYRAFLLASNGGRPVECNFMYADETGPYTDGEVNVFYGLHDGRYARLDKMIRTARAVIPRDFMPIAGDSGGNEICLGISGPNFGKVYFWDHDGASDSNPEQSYKQMHRVADSFAEFLEKLQP
jgi:hypothetical protein